MKFSFVVKFRIPIFILLILIGVTILYITRNQSYIDNNVNEMTYSDYQEKSLSGIKMEIFAYISETDDYELKFNKKTTTTVRELIQVLQEGIIINGKKYGPYLGQSPGGGLKNSDIFQNKPIKISIYLKEFDIDVRWSNSNEISINK